MLGRLLSLSPPLCTGEALYLKHADICSIGFLVCWRFRNACARRIPIINLIPSFHPLRQLIFWFSLSSEFCLVYIFLIFIYLRARPKGLDYFTYTCSSHIVLTLAFNGPLSFSPPDSTVSLMGMLLARRVLTCCYPNFPKLFVKWGCNSEGRTVGSPESCERSPGGP